MLTPRLRHARIAHGKAVPMYDEPRLQRDFTFVDDIVDGLLAVANASHITSGVFNLGHSKPEFVSDLIGHLEQALGKQAEVVVKPLPKTELLVTSADISGSTAAFGFHPTTSLEHGLRKFVSWYRGYQLMDTQRGFSLERSQANFFHALREEASWLRHRSAQTHALRRAGIWQRNHQHRLDAWQGTKSRAWPPLSKVKQITRVN
eukprot:m.320248 g.320248  ORF g.320248 m.320248 type:complete len:204 (-) comp19706_c0_seq14:27-638(-)